MQWILIIYMIGSSGSVGVTTAEFGTEQACLTAAKTIKASNYGHSEHEVETSHCLAK